MPWEVRWFNEESIHYDTVLKWFKSIDNVFQTETRTDQYIFCPYSEDIGIKLRQYTANNEQLPRLEIKWRKSTIELKLLNNSIVGTAEDWIKWVWTGIPVVSTDKSIDFFAKLPHGPGISIKKNRLMRKYKFDKKVMKSTTWIEDCQNGLACEITKISAVNKGWWSFGFEAFGSTINENEFKNAIASALSDFPLKLKKESSYGYPHWLTKIGYLC